jgi:osmotically-inducible protein OsmY
MMTAVEFDPSRKHEVSTVSSIRGISRAAITLAIVCSAAACVAPRKSAEQLSADRDTADRVQSEFTADKTLYSRHITVRADAGVVTLGGYAWTPEEIVQAQQDAERASGVTKVVNRIEVDRGAVQDSSVTR